VCVSQVVDADVEPEPGFVERGQPDAFSEPLAGDVSCGGYGPGTAGSVLTFCATLAR
jgi:hypothetical protein